MTNLKNHIGRVFDLGCGISLSDALKSPKYAVFLEREQELQSRFPKDSDEGIALRAGHLKMGTLLHCMSERSAIEEARAHSKNEPDTEIRAMIHLLGDSLVGAAQECLPDEAVKLAGEWSKKPSSGQIKIVQRLFNMLRSSWQKSLAMNEENFEHLAYAWIEDRQNQNPVRVLPKQFGKFGSISDPKLDPNCVGKALMLVAFARLAGAEVLTVGPVHDAMSKRWSGHDKVSAAIFQDLNERKLSRDPEFDRSLKTSQKYDSAREYEREGFHVAVAMRLKNKKWILIDPHQLTWGIFPAEWNMENTSGLLSKYQSVLPGLSITADDHGIAEKWVAERMQKTQDYLEQSRQLEEAFGHVKNPGDLREYIPILFKMGLIRMALEGEGVSYDEALEKFGEAGLGIMYLLGSDAMWGSMSEIMMFGMDSEYRKKRLDVLYTFFHYRAIQEFDDVWWRMTKKEGRLIHPVAEFQMPEYNLALSVLNSTNNHWRLCLELDDFILDNSFDQIGLHNVSSELIIKARFGWPVDHGRVAAMSSVLSTLRFLHPLCREKLTTLKQLERRLQ